MKNTKRLKNAVDRRRLIGNLAIESTFSLVVAFFIGLLNCLVAGNNIAIHFSFFYYKYFVLAGLIFITIVCIQSYSYYRSEEVGQKPKQLKVIMLSILFTFSISVIFGHYISVYAMPLMLVGLLIATLIDWKLALFANILVNMAFFYFFSSINPSFSFLALAGAIFANVLGGTLLITRLKILYSRLAMFSSGLIVGGLVNIPVAVLSAILISDFSVTTLLTTLMWSAIGLALNIALFMILLPVFENIFRLYSNFRLEEICSPEYPLIKELAEKAPGTYSHSMSVASLAQACAFRIGENPSLAKAAAYYHDIGKLKNPLCFTENQKGYNPHDDYIPEVSVFMITEHAKLGSQRIKQERLPDILADVCVEHHGTTAVKYFFYKMKNITDNQLDQEEYCYTGPKPRTKLSAIIMIVDTVEAATRSVGVDSDEHNFRLFIHKLIEEKFEQQQFTDCPITFRDLQTIEDTLVDIVPSFYHQRIKYTLK